MRVSWWMGRVQESKEHDREHHWLGRSIVNKWKTVAQSSRGEVSHQASSGIQKQLKIGAIYCIQIITQLIIRLLINLSPTMQDIRNLAGCQDRQDQVPGMLARSWTDGLLTLALSKLNFSQTSCICSTHTQPSPDTPNSSPQPHSS